MGKAWSQSEPNLDWKTEAETFRWSIVVIIFCTRHILVMKLTHSCWQKWIFIWTWRFFQGHSHDFRCMTGSKKCMSLSIILFQLFFLIIRIGSSNKCSVLALLICLIDRCGGHNGAHAHSMKSSSQVIVQLVTDCLTMCPLIGCLVTSSPLQIVLVLFKMVGYFLDRTHMLDKVQRKLLNW